MAQRTGRTVLASCRRRGVLAARGSKLPSEPRAPGYRLSYNTTGTPLALVVSIPAPGDPWWRNPAQWRRGHWCDEDDGNSFAELPHRSCCWRATDEYNVGRQPDQRHRAIMHSLGVAGAPAKLGPQIAAFDPAKLSERLTECRDKDLKLRIVIRGGDQHADKSHAPVLLRPRRQRHAAATPPSSDMNARRFTRSPYRRGRASEMVNPIAFAT